MWTHSAGWGVDITTVGGTGAVDYNPFDISGIGHGTHVAGLMAAVSNNSQGIIGTMPYRAKIMAIKMFKVTNGELTTTSQHFF
ncbi:MAG: S8 family serine peptidase, partial [Bdellovibrionaceae bacterium]|nr:S8 family serine peptidase [Pseudobdellovibrionaceae bacterium]